MLFAIPFVKVSEGSGIRSGMQGGADEESGWAFGGIGGFDDLDLLVPADVEARVFVHGVDELRAGRVADCDSREVV